MSTFAILALAGSDLVATANSASAAASALTCAKVFDDGNTAGIKRTGGAFNGVARCKNGNTRLAPPRLPGGRPTHTARATTPHSPASVLGTICQRRCGPTVGQPTACRPARQTAPGADGRGRPELCRSPRSGRMRSAPFRQLEFREGALAYGTPSIRRRRAPLRWRRGSSPISPRQAARARLRSRSFVAPGRL